MAPCAPLEQQGLNRVSDVGYQIKKIKKRRFINRRKHEPKEQFKFCLDTKNGLA
jgi:hypothetical protein